MQVKTGCCGLDPTTGRGKQIHLLQILLLPFIPILALIIQNSINMVTVLEYQYDMQETIDQVRDRGNGSEYDGLKWAGIEEFLKIRVCFLLAPESLVAKSLQSQTPKSIIPQG